MRMTPIILALTLAISPAEAVAIAATDAGTLGPGSYAFYTYHLNPTKSEQAASCYEVNMALSHATRPVHPVPLAGGAVHRWDLLKLLPQESDRKRVLGVLDSLTDEEPYFRAKSWVKTPCTPYRAADGKTYNYTAKTVSQPAVHVGVGNYLLLSTLTGLRMPIVRGDWLASKILSTVDGGRYYDLLGFTGKSQAQILALFGADEKLVAGLRSDQRTAILASRVSGRSRVVDALFGVGVRPEFGPSLVTITHDIADQDESDANRDPWLNLLKQNDRAREIIAQRPNGTFAGFLSNGAGVLQATAPEDVAHDYTIPDPHPQVLQAVISCIACHGADGGRFPFWAAKNGPVPNDVQALYRQRLEGTNYRGDVFGDRGKSDPDTLDRLAGLYTGDLTIPVIQARDALFRSCFLITGGQDVPTTFGTITARNHKYNYARIGAEQALTEIGKGRREGESWAAAFNRQVSPTADIGVGYRPEDGRILALRAGLTISRRQFEQVVADIGARAK